MKHTYIIAEAGVNHNGSEELAFKLVDAAYKSGVDAVKFQTFKASKLVTKNAKQAGYQEKNTGLKESQFEMLSRLELSFESHRKLIDYCNKLNIDFLSTAFDSESLKFLVSDLGLKRLKIPSGDLTNAPLVLEHARTGCDLIVSTGMATLSEVEMALGVIAFGYTADLNCSPSIDAFQTAYFSLEGQQALKEKVVVLHCTTEYPAPMVDINLKAMHTLETAFGVKAGYSDHSEGVVIPVAAVALGATVIEKHFTLDKNMEGPDHKASLEPDELTLMVKAIRDVDKALGDGLKGPRVSEIKNKGVARKSLVTVAPVRMGEVFNTSNLDIKRPGTGISPYSYWSFLGRKATQDYSEGEVIID